MFRGAFNVFFVRSLAVRLTGLVSATAIVISEKINVD